MLVAAVAIVLLTAAAASTAAIETVNTVADLFAKGPLVKSKDLTVAGADSPTTFLILGSDQRGPGAVDSTLPPHSDTILLVHLDPRSGLWSEMSIPRDFHVLWRWKGVSHDSKINFAFTVGGVDASLHVVKDLLRIPINYVVDINFYAFDKIVDKLGCVYVDVDHLYLNTPAEAQLDNYAAINVRPGYQPLCGEHALDYVRYRHDDNTFARDAREQGFLRDAKQQLGLSGLLGHASDIITALSKSITSNIRGGQTVLGLLETAINSVSGPVNQVQFPNYPQNVGGQDDQTASRSQIRAAVAQFEQPSVAAPVVHSIAATTHSSSHGGNGRTVHTAAPPSAPGLVATPPGVINDAAPLAPDVSFPVYVPSLTLDTASPDGIEPYSHWSVRDPQGHLHLGYRIDFSTGAVASYYGIEGMNWTDPPLFDHADTVDRYGRHYLYVNTGGKVQDVGWIVGNALYWVSNTIFASLSNRQMFALAESASAIGG